MYSCNFYTTKHLKDSYRHCSDHVAVSNPFWANSFLPLNSSINFGYLYGSALAAASNPFSTYSFYSTPRYDYSGMFLNSYLNSVFQVFNSWNTYAYQPTFFQPQIYTLPTLNSYQNFGYGSYQQEFSRNNSYSGLSFDPTSWKSLSSKRSTHYYNRLNAPKNNKDISAWQKLGYNAQKGLELARNALSRARGFTGYCATYVKQAIEKTGLGKYQKGDAYQMISIMRKNKNFKEINPSTVNVNNLPAGCVILFDRGVEGYSSDSGHMEITDGKGRGISDGITNNLRNPTAIFMPVLA